MVNSASIVSAIFPLFSDPVTNDSCMKMADEQGDLLCKIEQSLPDWNTLNDSLIPPIDIIHQKFKKDRSTVADPDHFHYIYCP